MDPIHFRHMIFDMSIASDFHSFVDSLNLLCGSSYLQKMCLLFIVSVVFPTEMHKLRTKIWQLLLNVIRIDYLRF